MILLLTQLAFAIELYADVKLWRKGKPDVPWQARVLFMLAMNVWALNFCGATDFWGLAICFAKLWALSFAPYCVFDPAIAVIKMGWRKWDYLGHKKWDRSLVRFNPWALLIARIVLCVGLYWIGL